MDMQDPCQLSNHLWLHRDRKNPDAGKDWGQGEKEATEDEMVGWHHWLNRHEFEQTPGVGEGQGSLVSCSPWGCKELDMTEWLNNSNNSSWFRSNLLPTNMHRSLSFSNKQNETFFSPYLSPSELKQILKTLLLTIPIFMAIDICINSIKICFPCNRT